MKRLVRRSLVSGAAMVMALSGSLGWAALAVGPNATSPSFAARLASALPGELRASGSFANTADLTSGSLTLAPDGAAQGYGDELSTGLARRDFMPDSAAVSFANIDRSATPYAAGLRAALQPGASLRLSNTNNGAAFSYVRDFAGAPAASESYLAQAVTPAENAYVDGLLRWQEAARFSNAVSLGSQAPQSFVDLQAGLRPASGEFSGAQVMGASGEYVSTLRAGLTGAGTQGAFSQPVSIAGAESFIDISSIDPGLAD